jgi:hypothetical protein
MPNDSVIIVSLSNSLVIPFHYSNKALTDLDNVERKIKKLTDLFPEKSLDSLCSGSKPFLCKINTNKMNH